MPEGTSFYVYVQLGYRQYLFVLTIRCRLNDVFRLNYG